MSDPDTRQRPAGETADAYERLSASEWYRIGRRTAPAYLKRRDWLYRRVESIEFVGHRLVNRHVSVDFEIPSGLPSLGPRGAVGVRWAPVSMLAKWPPVMGFSLFDTEGRPASLVTGETNKALDLGLLIGMADCGRVELPPALRKELAALIASDDPNEPKIPGLDQRMRKSLEIEGELSPAAAEIIDFANQLGDHLSLWVPVTGKPGTDRIIKFSYLDGYDPRESHVSRLLTACSWRERTIGIRLRHAGLHTRYHLDVVAPGEGLEIMRAQTFAFPGAHQQPAARTWRDRRRARAAADVPKRALPATQTPAAASAAAELPDAADVQIIDRRAHVYHRLRDVPSHRLFVWLRLAPARSGFITGCVVSALLIALLVSLGYWRLPYMALHLDSSVVLFGAVPVVLGYVLVRPGAHALERYHLAGVRAMALVAGAIPILAALLLVATNRPVVPDELELPDVILSTRIWALLLEFSWLIAVGLALSWLFAAKAGETGRDFRWTRLAPNAGSLFAGAFIIGTLLDSQPYTRMRPAVALRRHLVHYEGWTLLAVTAMTLGAIALYPFIGGAWRAIDKPIPRQRRWTRGTVAAVACGSGVVWVSGTVAALLATAWQVLTIHTYTDPTTVGATARVIDAVQNATLPLAFVFVLATSIGLAVPTVLPYVAVRVVVGLSGVVAATLIAIRGLDVWFGGGGVSPQVAWLALAGWVLVAANGMRYLPAARAEKVA